MKAIRQRLAAARPTAICGAWPAVLEQQEALVQVPCSEVSGPFEALLEAEHRVRERLGAEPRGHALGPGLSYGPRHALLENINEPRRFVDAWVDTLNALQRRSNGTVEIAFRDVDLADGASLAALRLIVLRRDWLRLPVLFHYGRTHVHRDARHLLQTLELVEGSAGVVFPDLSESTHAAGAGELRAPEGSVTPRPEPEPSDDEDVEAVIHQNLATAAHIAEHGAYAEAMELVTVALHVLHERFPADRPRHELRIQALLLLNRLKWLSATVSEENSLDQVLDSLHEIRALLRSDDPVFLSAELLSLLGSVHFELGTPAALQAALHELSDARQSWLEAGLPLQAARLLNDEAAVWVRLGDQARARDLLQQSQRIFATHAYPAARAELAEGNHLRARLIFHGSGASLNPTTALTYAHAAERTYRELQRPRELARTWATIGRLQTLLGEGAQAAEYLTAAIDVQEQLGDVTGLAQSTATLSLLLAGAGDIAGAIAWIAHSVALNREKCCTGGLRYNELALADLAARVAADTPEGLQISQLQRLVARGAASREADPTSSPAPGAAALAQRQLE